MKGKLYSGRTLDELREEYIRRGIDGAGQVYINPHGTKFDRTKNLYAKHMDFDGNAFIIQNCGLDWGVLNEEGVPVYGMGRVDELNYLKYRLIKDDHDIKKERKQR